MRLVAWNQRYLDLFLYPPGFVFAGKPVEELIRYNAERGWCGPGDPAIHTPQTPGVHARGVCAYFGTAPL